MNYYGKAILYIYPKLENIISQIDQVIMKKALASFSDVSPCEVQAEKILALIKKKDLLIDLKIKIDEILTKFTEDELKYFEYKYFKRKPKSFFEGFDVQGRNYFRKQNKLFEKFMLKLKFYGVTELFDEYAKINFFEEIVERLKNAQKESQ